MLRTVTGTCSSPLKVEPHNQLARSVWVCILKELPVVIRHTGGGLTPAPDVLAQAAIGNWMRP